MQIVIDIPKEILKTRYYTDYFGCGSHKLTETLDNAISLPKHGRLIDGDYLYKKFEANGCNDSNVYRLIKDEPTILEATKESKE